MPLKLDTTKALNVITEEDVAKWRRVIARLDDTLPPPPPVPPVVPPVPPPQPSTLFDPTKHLKQTRVWRLPQKAVGEYTGFAAGLLAVREMDGELHFLSDTHQYTAGSLYSFTLPKDGKGEFVTVTGEPGQSLYDGKRPENKRVNGLLIPESEPDTLYWVGDQVYDTADKTDTVAFATKLKPGKWEVDIPAPEVAERAKMKAKKSLAASSATTPLPNPAGSNNLWTRGAFVELTMPGGKKVIARGAGGYYSIIAGGSAGPCIVLQDGTVLLGFPWDQHHCARPSDFTSRDGKYPDVWVVKAPGEWTASDTIGGEDGSCGAFQLSGPLRGIVFAGVRQGTGPRQYGVGGQDLLAPPRVSRVYVFDPDEVFSDTLAPWEPKPHYFDMPIPTAPFPLDPGIRASGGAIHKDRWYQVWTWAVNEGSESYPILVEYQIG